MCLQDLLSALADCDPVGHEGGGTVESVGEGVTDVKAGDHVIPVGLWF